MQNTIGLSAPELSVHHLHRRVCGAAFSASVGDGGGAGQGDGSRLRRPGRRYLLWSSRAWSAGRLAATNLLESHLLRGSRQVANGSPPGDLPDDRARPVATFTSTRNARSWFAVACVVARRVRTEKWQALLAFALAKREADAADLGRR